MEDVERVVRRDFPLELTEPILQRIATIDVREKARVMLACLKIAAGSHDRLQSELRDAAGYYREILSAAEYPMATKRWSRMQTLSDQERASIFAKDWKQYSDWLGRAVDEQR